MYNEIIKLDSSNFLYIYHQKNLCLNIYYNLKNSNNYQILKTLKDDNRSLVRLIEFEKKKYVYKIPREKNYRKWIRFTTVFRNSEAIRALNNMNVILKLGLVTSKPVFAYEKKNKLMVVDSFYVYEYIEAESISDKYYPAIINTLKTLHYHDYLHHDAHLENFLIKNEKIILIDANLKKIKYFKKLQTTYEFVYLLNKSPEIKPFLIFDKKSFYFKIGNLYYKYLNIWRFIKKTIRKIKSS